MNAETKPTENDTVVVRVEEAARLLCIGRTRVYDLISSGELKSVKIFGARRVPRAAIDSYVHALLQEGEAA
ncbi:helix-turn-helix domain-containing protein [Amycolatopsis sp. NBC_00355]|uniref:helix-turn-helix domain-containing protein n=1 Tax=Amycolatopsis sp. NBC_00355 TaxID=2975957 RepID=UPI002E25B2C6